MSRSALAMCVSMLALSVAVNVHANESSVPAQKTPPERALVDAARKKCEADNGVTREKRPTKEQHEAMKACMKAAGFERPPGPPHGNHHGPPPEAPPPPADAPPGAPPEEPPPIDSGGSQ